MRSLDIPIINQPVLAEILITFYRNRADGPIHAVEFSVIEEGVTVSRVNPIHLKNVPQGKLRRHIKDVLGVLKAEFGQDVSVVQEKQSVSHCPICLGTSSA